MTQFGKLYAKAYDLLYESKDYQGEARFIDSLITELRGKESSLLDFACGTGRHLLEFSNLGYKVRGSDISSQMLTEAKARLRPEVELSVSDMRIRNPGPDSDIAICLFDAIGYLESDADVVKALHAIPIKKKGLLFIEYWHAPRVLSSLETIKVREVDSNGSKLIRISRSHLAKEKNFVEVLFDVFLETQKDQYERVSEIHNMRYFEVLHFNELLKSAGFKSLRDYSGYTRDPVSDETWHVLSVSEKVA